MEFDQHAAMLRGEDVPRSINEPIAGWYRIRRKGRDGAPDTFVPVRYQYVGDFGQDMECYIAGLRVSDQQGREQWPWASANPVTREAYDAVMRGYPWPDVDQAVHAASGLGHNRPPDESPEDELRAKIEAAMSALGAYVAWRDANPATLASSLQDGKITSHIADDGVLARAQTLRALFLGFSSEAVKRHKAEKEPHLEAGRAVDRKWFALRDLAQNAADALRRAMSSWETAKLRAENERAETARKAAEEVPMGAPPTPVAPSPPAAPRKIKGGSGRAASVATITQVQSVNDWSALAAFFCLQADVQSSLLKHANAMLRTDPSAKVPGVVTQQVRDVK